MNALYELAELVKVNFDNLTKGFFALVTAWLTYRITIGKNKIEAAKVGVDSKKADLDEDTLLLQRANAVDQRMDRLVAHLEKRLEESRDEAKRAAEDARREREELKQVVTTQTKEIKSLRDHVALLTKMVLGLGGEPPPYKSYMDE